ncbi:MAG: hypothetical protein DSY80_06635 [Desulfocapsa sp.]|nr:MAG: hypothetical protein DSY80_06635 [Desulfocapsa sp.]
MKEILHLILLISLFVLASCQADSSSPAAPDTVKLLPPLDNKIYFGAFPDFGGPEDIVSQQRIKDFEVLAGKNIAWAYFSNNWFKGLTYPQSHIQAIRDSDAVPFVRLMPRSDTEQGLAENHFSLQNIIDGVFDAELKIWAQAAIADAKPLLVDFAVEPNGDWFGWSGIFNGGSTTDAYGDPTYPDGPERYRDAYRHVIDLFREEGAKHITWFFHFNYASFPDVAWNKPHYYYPGDNYIDWIGTSLYGSQMISEEWDGLAFSEQLAAYVEDAQAVSMTKPMALLEFGVTDYHPDGSKALWLNDAFTTILDNAYIKFDAISPWHENWENEDSTLTTIRLDSSVEALSVFKENIAANRFISKLRFNHH